MCRPHQFQILPFNQETIPDTEGLFICFLTSMCGLIGSYIVVLNGNKELDNIFIPSYKGLLCYEEIPYCQISQKLEMGKTH